MKSVIRLERDSDNSDPGEAEVEPFENSRGEWVSIKLSGPEREITLPKKELLHAIYAPRV